MSLLRRAPVAAAGVVLFWGAQAGIASAQPPPIALQSIASGLSLVTAITNAHDGSGRLFITLQSGQVRIYDGCQLLGTPFLDVSSLILSGGERGLLSIAFHWNFPATPYFYVYYTRSPDGAIVIARYRVSTGNPNLADTSTAVVLMTIPHPGQSNHNGGQLQFGPDHYLYAGTGDGGSGNDPPCNAQNDGVMLGKILRLDVDQNFNTSPYHGIPPTNPIFGAGPRDEKWAKGVRNPWRFGFDRSTGDLIIGDVGQSAREEVDFHPAGTAGGQNWGWRMMEGTICGAASNVGCQAGTPACGDPSLLLPVFDYDHNTNGRCSITGGYRYRGTQVAGLGGFYIYGDYCSGEIFAANNPGGTWTSGTASALLDNAFNITTFGEDEAGELYVAGAPNVYRIVGAATRNADLSITKDDGQTIAVAGGPITYTIAASNAGPYAASSAVVADTFPAALQNVNWTCSASAGSSCCSITSGNTLINRPVMILPGGTVTFTATATISAGATGTLSNTATVTAPATVTDPAAGNNSATDTDTLATPTDLAITKDDGQTTAAPGQVRTYTIVATNNGPAPATGATVTDVVPAALTGATWTCVGANGGTCGNASGGPDIMETVNLPVGGSVTYTLTGTVGPNPSNLRNTATVAVPSGMSDPNPANNSATDDDVLTCVPQVVVVPDGRVTPATIGAGAQVWFAASLRIGNSYSVELKSLGDPTAPGTLTLYSGDDGCSGASTLTPRDTTAIDPGAGAASRRVSFTATGTGTFFQAKLDNGTGPDPIPISVSWSDTTMFSPAWSTNGSFNTYYSFQNTTGLTISGTLTLLSTSGAVVTTFPVSVPPGQTMGTNTSSLGVARNRTGTAKFTHDGPPGAMVVEAAIANFSSNPAYVQPVKFQPVREATH